ncbi:MAG: pirin family protein, partial [Eudoraea sp.]|nr:pirin family protein [Eudoraea sp.]
AWFYLGEFYGEQIVNYQWNNRANGVYLFVLDGKCSVNDQLLEKRDGYGIWEITAIDIDVSEFSKILLMEIPI